MTPDKLTDLAQRLRDHAATLAPNATREDMIEAARYLRECAQAEPAATVRVHNTGGNAGIAWSGVPTEHAGTMRGGTPLYANPQPQQAGVPGRWADIVEQRLLTWRQRFTNRSGDQLALDDFMDQQSIDDLVDFVCDEHAATQPPSAFPFPISYDRPTDVLTINGKRYAAGLFDERGLLAPAGTVVRIEDGPDDTVTLTRLQQPPSAQAEPTIDINIKIAVPANWSNRLDMQWIVEREIHADRWSWSYAAPQAMNTQADAIEALRGVASEHDIGYAAGWRNCADEAARIVASHIDRLEPGRQQRVRDALLDLLASMRSILVSQRHNPITDEMNAALRYARTVLAAQGGKDAE